MLDNQLKRVMIVAGESSGELYGAYLARELKRKIADIRIIGVGGERMDSEGVELIARISSLFGLVEALKSYSQIKRTFQKVIESLKSFNPQLLVLIDYPDFNIKVAKEAKRHGIKILYYVSPQVWAWRKGRIKTIGRLIDEMAVILPFEEELYKSHNIPCEFVGHPIMDELKDVLEQLMGKGYLNGKYDFLTDNLKSKAKEGLALKPHKPLLTLMPGSRPHEIEKLLPVISDVIIEVSKKYPDFQFLIPIAPNLQEKEVEKIKALEYTNREITIVKGQSMKALIASDIAIIASGTSALQAAIVGVPMIVLYKLSFLTYIIGRLIVKVRHISLPNILLDKSRENDSGVRIKEFLQKEVNKENIMKEIDLIINDRKYRDDIKRQLKKIREMFIHKEASSRVAGKIKSLLES